MSDKSPHSNWREPLWDLCGEMLLYGVIAGLFCLGSYLISFFFRFDWHLVQYVVLALIIFFTIAVVAVYRRSRQRL